MGTCGYFEQRPPLSKVNPKTYSSINSTLLSSSKKQSWPTPTATASDKYKPSKLEKMVSIA